MTSSKRGQGGDIIDDAMGEVRGAADQEDRVGIDEAADSCDVDFICGCWTCD